MNLAAIDIGTNSARLLIADAQGNELARPMRITRLGQGVDVTGSLATEAIERTVAVLREYRDLCDQHGVQRLRATATSAARDAKNSADFFDAAEQALRVRPELISGDEEARLSFRGATSGIAASRGPFLIFDIGGGSTELVVGTTEPEALVSLQLGCVRMTERHLKSDPPTDGEISACLADVRTRLAGVGKRLGVQRARLCIGLAGTVTALSAMQLGLQSYDASRTHHSRLTRSQVERLFDQLAHATIAQRRGLLAEPQRADVIVGGAAVLVTLLRELAIDELLVSEHDILDGLVASLSVP
jgi:exopolyphosphatase/guanosine-5'-triphosphate,3'-diphosphate pyrophosphatase